MAINFPWRRNTNEAKDDKKNTNIDITSYDFPDLTIGSFIDQGSFSKFRELSSDREAQYIAYDDIATDVIISSALEMYADDASQVDSSGNTIWVESPNDKGLADYLNNLLETLNIPKMLWGIYYSLAEYGDVYLRLYKKENLDGTGANKNNLNEAQMNLDVPYENYVELVKDPENVFELVKRGKTCQYAYTNKNTGKYHNDRIELYPPDQFIHIYIENPSIREREDFEFKTIDETDHKEKVHKYQVRRGKSMLHDIYAVEQEIRLIEDSLLLNRLSRSIVTRLISVEVGDMPKTEVRRLTRRVKSALESKLSFNKNKKQMRAYNSPSGIDNIVINTTRNGKGNMQIENVGGDVDIKSLLDLDYFTNKLFGGLKIPKAFLGFDDSLSGNSGGTLTRMDARYSRTIKRLQNCVIAGVTDLLNLFLLHSGQEQNVNNFTVRVVTPSTIEDAEREDSITNAMNTISQVSDLITNASASANPDLVKYLLKKSLKDPSASKFIDDTDTSKKQNNSNGNDGGGFGGFGY